MNADDVRRLVVTRFRRYPNMPHIRAHRANLQTLKPSDAQPRLAGGRVAVYVILDHCDAVQYVGQTAHPTQRMSAHRGRGVLAPDGRVLWFVTQDRQAALSCEQSFIATLNPKLNIMGSQFQWERDCQGLTLDELVELTEAAA